MSKKGKLEYDEKLSYFENFLRYILNGKKTVGEAIRYLSMLSAKCIAKIGICDGDITSLPQEEKDDLISFYENFMDEFDDITNKARLDTWGPDDAFILRVGAALAQLEYEEEKDEVIKSLTENDLKECDEYIDAVFSLQGDKHITYESDDMSLEQDIPGKAVLDKADKETMDWYRSELKYALGNLFGTISGITIREVKKNGKSTLYGIRMMDDFWEPVSAKEMEEAYTTTPSGYRLAPDEGETFGEIHRKDEPVKVIKPETKGKSTKKSDSPGRSIFKVIK